MYSLDMLEEAPIAAPEKPHYSAKDVAEYCKAHGITYWRDHDPKRKPAKKGITVITPVKEECTACNGTGTWVGARYQRKCLRCGGLGTIDSVRANANRVYDAHRAAGTNNRSYKEYDNQPWVRVA